MSHRRLILIGCGSAKQSSAYPAKDLYTGSLFRARRQYAESRADYWFILSAKYGLLEPERQIDPYELDLRKQSAEARTVWTYRVAEAIKAVSTQLTDSSLSVEIHAGAPYAENLQCLLEQAGCFAEVQWPVRGLTQGAQMRFYAQARGPAF